MEVITTYGGAHATAYIGLDAAHTLITTSRVFYDAWTAANSVQRGAALIQAAKQIGSQNWRGKKYFTTQRLDFPRSRDGFDYPSDWNVGQPDGNFYSYIEQDEFHRDQRGRVEAANAYQALYILENGGEEPYREDQHRGLGGRQKGVRFSDGWQFREASYVLCPEAMDELRIYYSTGPRIERGGGSYE